jgi:hypothetical protein
MASWNDYAIEPYLFSGWFLIFSASFITFFNPTRSRFVRAVGAAFCAWRSKSAASFRRDTSPRGQAGGGGGKAQARA